MKELTIEQKAKRYDEAIEIAKKNYITAQDLCDGSKIGVECFKNTLELIFPEFKESDDENIRKAIIEHFAGSTSSMYPYKGFTKEQIISWLEKQGEQKLVEWSEKDENEYNHILKILNLVAEEQKTKGYNNLISSINWLKSFKDRIWSTQSNKPQGKSALEAINEKTVDNANNEALNFKAGDWVVRTNGESFCNGSKFAQIQSIELDGEMCYFDTGRWLYPSEIRLWTINDAQDGDVLCYKDEISLYKHDIKNCTKEEATFGGFVYYGCYDGKRFITSCLYSLTEQDKMNIHPATKEQRDLLFAKMKDAEYVWDSKNKKLIRIE